MAQKVSVTIMFYHIDHAVFLVICHRFKIFSCHSSSQGAAGNRGSPGNDGATGPRGFDGPEVSWSVLNLVYHASYKVKG